MKSRGLSRADREEVVAIADARVERFFNHYLLNIFPKQVGGLIRAHDTNVFAHGGLARRFAKLKYLILGFAAAGGFGVAKIGDLIGLL